MGNIFATEKFTNEIPPIFKEKMFDICDTPAMDDTDKGKCKHAMENITRHCLFEPTTKDVTAFGQCVEKEAKANKFFEDFVAREKAKAAKAATVATPTHTTAQV